MFKRFFTIFLVGIFFSHDGNASAYQNEANKRDLREIVILSYGSLVNNPSPTDGREALKIEGNFQKTNESLPVALSRKSRGDRITAVIDNKLGEDKKVYYAISGYKFLPNARLNLALREGATSQDKLKYIYYMKKKVRQGGIDNNEEKVSGVDGWYIRKDTNRSKIDNQTAKKLAQWADREGFTAIIWASFPPTFNSKKEVAKTLVDSPAILEATKGYVELMPDGAQTAIEKAVINKDKETLKRIAGMS